MALQSHGQLLTGNAVAVVFNTDESHATGKQAQINVCGTGVQCVVNQLLDNRGRALNHLASGDLADQLAGQLLNGTRLIGWGQCCVHTRILDDKLVADQNNPPRQSKTDSPRPRNEGIIEP